MCPVTFSLPLHFNLIFLYIGENSSMVFKKPSSSFTWNPADYHKSSSSQKLWARELIEKLGFFGNERVIDIGCGDGGVTAAIASRVPRGAVTGIDSSREMIRFAKKRYPPRIFPNLSFVCMDARNLTFTEEFDVAFSNAALHWITDHRPVLAGIAQVLCPGGTLLIQMGGKGNADQVFYVLDILVEKQRWRRYFEEFSFNYGFFGTEEYRRWLEDAGLEPVRVELIPKDMSYQNREDFAGWIRTTWLPWMSQLPEREKPAFINACIDEYLVMYPAGSDGSKSISG
jgi:trans-aconitate 2-methyltransferase